MGGQRRYMTKDVQGVLCDWGALLVPHGTGYPVSALRLVRFFLKLPSFSPNKVVENS